MIESKEVYSISICIYIYTSSVYEELNIPECWPCQIPGQFSSQMRAKSRPESVR